MTGNAVVERLRAAVEAEGSPLSDSLVAHDPAPVFGPLAAAGPRAAAAQAEYSLLVEAIFEGYLLHYGSGRLLAPGDRDVSLLGGDFLYAYGLAALARLGDSDAIEDLAGLIAHLRPGLARSRRRAGRVRRGLLGPDLPVGGRRALARAAAAGRGRAAGRPGRRRRCRELRCAAGGGDRAAD